MRKADCRNQSEWWGVAEWEQRVSKKTGEHQWRHDWMGEWGTRNEFREENKRRRRGEDKARLSTSSFSLQCRCPGKKTQWCMEGIHHFAIVGYRTGVVEKAAHGTQGGSRRLSCTASSPACSAARRLPCTQWSLQHEAWLLPGQISSSPGSTYAIQQ
ncbi:hypothetical protein EJ06DRAFT_392137 [Trichodelitschia bisporula]|uniref:Uncharacterized protein n=1 Tax=Trichodelitschia bisporula TaxID=703511 RepID=A0A6G1HZR8_9PEZI|nr:hypothetical protein EJ06DRAFT_392137 [Trichodelitschia bisporula]